ncbi:hypothetical protein BDF14DRAFT_1745091 [Spinellus fusiger]|nr:hypothetical protein BDF14DRAFT_1745091 [Spinellus fusiger]
MAMKELNTTKHPHHDSSSRSEPPMSPDPWHLPSTTDSIGYDLQDVLVYYQSQPELLTLILQSKVEEDRRRAEEAKLRSKELDLLIIQHQFNPSLSTNLLAISPLVHLPLNHPSAISCFQETASSIEENSRRNSLLHSTFGGSSHSEELVDDHSFSTISTAATHSLLILSRARLGEMSAISDPTSSPVYAHLALQDPFQTDAVEGPSGLPHSPHTRPSLCANDSPVKRLRRRREMQAITKIVETREHPYMDGYFWKNNGNTIQKKTGNKSVYYKCSNSNKGCPVNKTVTWKERGEYMIKYRGDHFAECSKVQRLVDV